MKNTLRMLALAGAMLMVGQSAWATTAFPSRTDFRDETIYFLMTTRFYDGDPSNNTQCWDGQSYNEGDPCWRGDFKGLIEKLDYIKALGFTAIWITPIVENASGYDYHGYHASNFSKVDHRYESDDVAFKDVVDAVHAKGMKIILDIVLNHTGNFGEANLCPLFERDWDADQSVIDDCMIPLTKSKGGKLPDNYLELAAGSQYSARLSKMKNTVDENGQKLNYDTHNYWHHYAEFNWDEENRWWGQIAGDCVDLNTENQAVVDYLLKCYGEFIKLGVDGFRIDTSGHISRLTFNKNFIPQFTKLAEQYKSARNNGPFFMFGEVCSRDRNVTYRNHDDLSPYFYTWAETKDYDWDTSTTSWDNVVVNEGETGDHTNAKSVLQFATDYQGQYSDGRTSTNALLNGNAYHTPDYSQASGFNVIDFPMHWNFENASSAFGVKSGDKYYNDATYNVVYVDSHDYAPDGAPESQRFAKPQSTWAENLCLMYTFRGIPCVYYGSEIEFKKGCIIDKGPNMPLRESGRAYYGGYIKGNITTTDFAEYSNASGNIAQTLKHPLAQHIQRLSKIRMAVPALRKGQYSTDGCSGSLSFKRRYTDSTTDSYALVTISGNSTFTNIPNGTYTDCVTGTVQTVTNNSLTATCSGTGNLRVYVLTTALTKAPGKIGDDGKYIYTSTAATVADPSWDGTQEELEDGSSSGSTSRDTVYTPCLNGADERVVFFTKSSDFGSSIKCYIWDTSNGNKTICGSWPGAAATSIGGGVYKYVLPDDADEVSDGWKIIWNDGSNQTKDLAFTLHGMYSGDKKDNIACTSTVTLDCSEAPEPYVPEDPETLVQKVEKDALIVYGGQGILHIFAPKPTQVIIYTISGQIIDRFEAAEGTNSITLPAGFYLVNGQKAVVH